MDEAKQKNPPAKMIGESLSHVFVDPKALDAELCERYAIYSETIRVQKGLVAAGAYYNCGVIHVLFGEYEQAYLNFKAALELDPHDKKARQNLNYLEGKLSTPVLTFHQTLDIYRRINANSGGQSSAAQLCAN